MRYALLAGFVVSGRQRYKIWEQFTTTARKPITMRVLFQDDKDTKFESNSQHHSDYFTSALRCFRTTKIQNLRAIHNREMLVVVHVMVVSGRQRYKIWEQFTTCLSLLILLLWLFQDDKDTKFESNSQRPPKHPPPNPVVSGRQRYKIWEQFTTARCGNQVTPRLFQDDKDTKFESNSQHALPRAYALSRCFRTTKIQNLRAIHNSFVGWFIDNYVVSGRQRYKIWEQFTTCS